MSAYIGNGEFENIGGRGDLPFRRQPRGIFEDRLAHFQGFGLGIHACDKGCEIGMHCLGHGNGRIIARGNSRACDQFA